MDKLSHIGYLVPEFPGQTHMFFWREINELRRLGHEVTLLSTRPPPKKLIVHSWSKEAIKETTYLAHQDIASAFRALSWTASRRTLAEQNLSLRDAGLCLPLAAKLSRICEQKNIQHVHVHSCSRSALIAALSSLYSGQTYSLTLHGALEDYGPLQNVKWRNASFGMVITDNLLLELRTHLGDDLPKRLVKQAMGVDTEHFKRISPYKPFDGTGDLRIFSCARLNPIKGHLESIAAIKNLRDKGVPAKLVIAGEDDSGGTGFRRVVEDKILELGLKDDVLLLGAVDSEEVKKNILQSHIFILASFKEALGVAFMEAMSCEVPTIGARVGGVMELIDDHVDGFLIPPRSAKAIVNAALYIIENPVKATSIGEAARRKVETNFSSRRGAEALSEQVEILKSGTGTGQSAAS